MAVSGGIAGDFASPILAIGLWHPAVPAAAVPKTPINEDDETSMPKDKIGTARKRLVPTPAGNSVGAEDGREP